MQVIYSSKHTEKLYFYIESSIVKISPFGVPAFLREIIKL